jgi:hypothetical protein
MFGAHRDPSPSKRWKIHRRIDLISIAVAQASVPVATDNRQDRRASGELTVRLEASVRSYHGHPSNRDGFRVGWRRA